MSFFFSESRERSSANLITLSSIILVAVSEEAYLAAARTPNLLRQLLQDGRVLRQGDICQTDGSLLYELWSLEPVSQGCALAGQTEIVVLSSSHPMSLPRDDVNNEHDFIEINEEFLASSVISSPHEHFEQGNGLSASNTVCVGRAEVPAYPFTTRDLTTPEDLLEDDFSLYIRTSDLGKIGILSHDWVCMQHQVRCKTQCFCRQLRMRTFLNLDWFA